MRKSLLNIITLIHIIYIIFVIIVPFTNSNYFLFLHAILIPFMMFHWLCNNNTCAITLAEKTLRKSLYGTDVNDSKDNCITCKIIEPIYDFTNNYKKYSKIIYIITIILWFIGVSKLLLKYKRGEISKIQDLIKL